MAILPLVQYPARCLRQVSQTIESIDQEVLDLADSMLETMYAAGGIGLAAPQIGISRRLAVIHIKIPNLSNHDDEAPAQQQPLTLINPVLAWSSVEKISSLAEGCLSIPGLGLERFQDVPRPAVVRVAFLDRDGEKREIEARGLMAACLEHEIDHLNGILYVDRIDPRKREMVLNASSRAIERGKA